MWNFMGGKLKPGKRVLDRTKPQMLGPDAAPLVSQVLQFPHVGIYNPDDIAQGPMHTAPLQPGAARGAVGNNADCIRAETAMYDRACRGDADLAYAAALAKATGIQRL